MPKENEVAVIVVISKDLSPRHFNRAIDDVKVHVQYILQYCITVL